MAERANRRGRGPMGHGPGMPGGKAQDFKGTLGKLLVYMSSYKPALIVVVVFAAANTVFNVAGPKILSRATTELFNGLMSKLSGGSGIDFSKIGRILLFLPGIYVCSELFSFVQGWIMTRISQEMSFRMRREISGKINRMPMNYFESRTVGEVLSRITNDVDTMGQSFNQAITQLITPVATIVGVFIMMLTISPLMALIALVILPISAVLMLIVMRFSQQHFKNHQKYPGDVNGQVEEIYSGHQVVKAFNREEQVIKNFNETNDKLYESAWKSQFMSGMMQPVMTFVGNPGYVAVAVSGSILAAKAAYAHHFIQTLPGGYQMELNEEAGNVSQGQKQLLTIAQNGFYADLYQSQFEQTSASWVWQKNRRKGVVIFCGGNSPLLTGCVS